MLLFLLLVKINLTQFIVYFVATMAVNEPVYLIVRLGSARLVKRAGLEHEFLFVKDFRLGSARFEFGKLD